MRPSLAESSLAWLFSVVSLASAGEPPKAPAPTRADENVTASCEKQDTLCQEREWYWQRHERLKRIEEKLERLGEPVRKDERR